MRQLRLRDGSTSRRAASSVSSKVVVVPKTLPHGFPSVPGGPAPTASTSKTALSGPSTSTSRRTLNRCWWYGAARPGAIMRAWGPGSPFATAMVDMIPLSLTSSCMVPSR